MKKLQTAVSLQEWVKIEKYNAIKILLSKNDKISNSKVIVVKSNKPFSLL